VKNLTETLAVEWAPYGIRVNGLVPGLFPHTDETANIKAVPGRGDRASEEASSPAGRTGRLRELGWAATFLASSYAAYITGHTLVVDGANWQRRALRQPDFTPIRQQLGKGPFTLE
jgi:NAD(P)-dependent dehydrogenase (short-subunit alcohol dehydrogenase family)